MPRPIEPPPSHKEERIIQTDRTPEEIRTAIEASAGEVHLQGYPIFAITSRRRKDTRYTYEERIIAKDGTSIIRSWTISVDSHYGWPGEHEAEVWRAIEHIIELRARRGIFENPFWTSFAEIQRYSTVMSSSGTQVNDEPREPFAVSPRAPFRDRL